MVVEDTVLWFVDSVTSLLCHLLGFPCFIFINVPHLRTFGGAVNHVQMNMANRHILQCSLKLYTEDKYLAARVQTLSMSSSSAVRRSERCKAMID